MTDPNPHIRLNSYSSSPYSYSEALSNQDDDLASDHQDDNSIFTEEEDGECVSEPHYMNKIPVGWKWVEVAGSFNRQEGRGGGGFILRNADGEPQLAQLFPVAADSTLCAEASALRKAMAQIISLGEDEVIFCFRSARLFTRLHARPEMPHDALEWIVFDCARCWERRHGIGLARWPKDALAAARWLAKRGRTCRQHCQWTGPWPEELLALL